MSCWIIGLRQQLPVKPALAGPSSMRLANSRRWILLSVGGRPGDVFECKPRMPRLNHARTTSLETRRTCAISLAKKSSANNKIDSTRFTRARSSACLALGCRNVPSFDAKPMPGLGLLHRTHWGSLIGVGVAIGIGIESAQRSKQPARYQSLMLTLTPIPTPTKHP
jgi:hypothetical protein